MGTFVMTGASRGLGWFAAVELLRAGGRLVVGARGDVERLRRSLAGESGGDVNVLPCDLASLASVRRFAAEAAEHGPFDGVLASAGIQLTSAATTTVDGFETTFAVNVMAPHLLLRLLTPSLTSTADVVVVTSDTHFGDLRHTGGLVPKPRWTTPPALTRPGGSTTRDGRRAYATSKLGVVHLVHAFARRLPPEVRIVSYNPALVPGTGLVRDGGAAERWAFRAVLPALSRVGVTMTPAAAGHRLAQTVLHLDAPTGSYVERGTVVPSSEESYDRGREDALWSALEQLTLRPGARC